MYWRVKSTLSLIIFTFSGVINGEETDNSRMYDGFQMLTLTVTEEYDVQELVTQDYLPCEILKAPDPLQILCPPADLNRVKVFLSSYEIEYSISIEDVGEFIRESEQHDKDYRNTAMDWRDYQRYETIVAWMEEVAENNPSYTTLIDMGRSVEGRKLYALKIGKSRQGNQTKAIWIEGGIHAREWISPATSTYIIDQLIQFFKQAEVSECSESTIVGIDWFVAPLMNPDGYEYSHTRDRLWRKNRRFDPTTECYGVDLNRNWDVIGFGIGASSRPCNIVYKGPSRGSEPETVAGAQTILKYRDNIRVFVSLHSYGEYWLLPYGYTSREMIDYDKQVNLGRRAIKALQCINPSRSYRLGPVTTLLYSAGGSSMDWAKIEAKIPYSLTIELPERSSFILDKSKIIPVGNEIWAAMKEISLEAMRHPLGVDPAHPFGL